MRFLDAITGTPNRTQALRRFGVTITIVNLLGHFYIGFETSYACTLVSVVSACVVQFFLEFLRGKFEGVEPMYSHGRMIDFLLPAYIVGMTCGMFLFTNGRLLPLVFATTVAIASKFLLRVPVGDRSVHFLNPSNLAIIVSLYFFPSVAMIMPFSFSAGLGDVGDVIFPVILFTLGCFVNGVLTKRLVLIFSWFGMFVVQAFARHWLFDTHLLAVLAVATGPIPMLFSFYMISDPGTTPNSARAQLLFGGSIGLIYALLTVTHVVYGIFLALMFTCILRGIVLYANHRKQASKAVGEIQLAA